MHVADCDGSGFSPGSILAGVCRAKLAEGIDFMDDQARMVIIVGVPLPNIFDPYIVIKREYYMKNDRCWLDKVAMRAVNQAIGRVIRHKDDFGSIVLIDHRYSRPDYHNRISHWLANRI